MTSDAYDLLDCFVSGIDEIVYEIAGSLAKSEGRVENGVVQISQVDVRKAANLVFEAIQANTAIPRDVAENIRTTHQCVLEKCRIKDSVK